MQVVQGDITEMQVDAIVNAANSSLMGGGGVDGAIHRKGGPEILEACKEIIREIGRCETGQAVITTAGNLPARHVIHTVGPVWKGGDAGESGFLADAYRNSLQLAADNGLTSVAFPNISTGVYGYPKDLAADVAIRTTGTFLKESELAIQVTFVCFDEENFGLYQERLQGQ